LAKFAEACELFNQNRLDEAESIFIDVLDEAALNDNEHLEAYEALSIIYKSLEKNAELLSLQRKYLQFLFEKKCFQAAQKIAENIIQLEKNPRLDDVYKLWACLSQNGEVERAEKICLLYLETLFQRKNFKKGLDFLNEIDVGKIQLDLAIYYRVKFFNLSKNFEALKNLLIENKHAFLTKNKLEKSSFLFKTAQYLIECEDNESFPQITTIKLELSLLMNCQIEDRIIFVRRFMNLLLVKDFDTALLKLLFSYTYQHQRLCLMQTLIKVLQMDVSLWDHSKKFKNKFEDVRREMTSWKKDSINESTVCEDLAEDLFENENVEGDSKKIKRIEKDIEILKKKNLLKEAELLLEKLKEIDPRNALFCKDNENKENNKEQSFGPFHFALVEKESGVEMNEAMGNLKSYFSHLDKNYICSNLKDLAVSLVNLEAWDIAQEFLERARELLDKNENWEQRLVLEYFLVVVYEKQNKNKQALIIIENVIRNYPVTEDEKILFYYLKGEICLRLKIKKEAKEALGFVFKKDPHYRLIQQRMKELAKS